MSRLRSLATDRADSDALNRATEHLDPLLKSATPGDDQTGRAVPPGGDSASPPVLSSEETRLGHAIVTCTDLVLVRYFGPAGRMEGTGFADQAAALWIQVVNQYLPTLAQSGPLGQLALVYSLHLSGAILARQPATAPATPAGDAPAFRFKEECSNGNGSPMEKSSELSESAGAEKPLSSAN